MAWKVGGQVGRACHATAAHGLHVRCRLHGRCCEQGERICYMHGRTCPTLNCPVPSPSRCLQHARQAGAGQAPGRGWLQGEGSLLFSILPRALPSCYDEGRCWQRVRLQAGCLGPGQLCVGLNRHLTSQRVCRHTCQQCRPQRVRLDRREASLASRQLLCCTVQQPCVSLTGASCICFCLPIPDCGAGPARRRPRHPGRNAQNHGGRQGVRLFSHWSISVGARFSSVVCGSCGLPCFESWWPCKPVPVPLPLPPFPAASDADSAASRSGLPGPHTCPTAAAHSAGRPHRAPHLCLRPVHRRGG